MEFTKSKIISCTSECSESTKFIYIFMHILAPVHFQEPQKPKTHKNLADYLRNRLNLSSQPCARSAFNKITILRTVICENDIP